MNTRYEGELVIDHDNGVVTFSQGSDPVDGEAILLRVTHLPTPVPDNVYIDLVAIRNVTSYTPLALTDSKKSGLAEWAERQEQDEGFVKFDMLCPICSRVHVSADFTKWGPYTFVVGHEYIIWTRNSQQTYAHSGRMQYMGRGPSDFKYQLAFNARGPDRSTSGNYGGTQMLDARNIVKLEEVERDPGKRYVDEIDRSMKK
jgi:hypothetical protein